MPHASTRRRAKESGDPRATGFEITERRYQGFAGQVAYPELAESLGYLAPIRLHDIGSTISGPQDIQTVVTGDTDFGGAFNGAVIKLIAAHTPIVAVIGMYGVDESTWGGFYVTDDSPIQKPRVLLGKKVAMNTLGAHSEFMLEEYLERQGIGSSSRAPCSRQTCSPTGTIRSPWQDTRDTSGARRGR